MYKKMETLRSANYCVLHPVKALILCTVLLAKFGSGQVSPEPACCDQARGSCASACKQFSLLTFAAESDPETRESLLRPLHTFCPAQLESFWQCMNQTKAALLEGAGWEGRYCCSMAQTRPCQLSCLTAQRTGDLGRGCRKSDEPAVYHCLAKQESFEKCCGQSKRLECGIACRNFLRDTPQPSNNRRHGLKKRLNAQCERDQAVMSCVSNLTHATPILNPERSLHCCSKGRTAECQEACRKAYRASSSAVVVMEILLEKGCGEPRPDDVMWGCFLQHAEPKGPELPSKIDRLGMDAAKLHCCHRAGSLNCRRLCHKTYSRDWTGQWSEYDQMCLSSQNERQLKDCVDEVEEPCELGCDGLNFCSAFNNRPSELFRRCNPAADLAARQQFEQWKSLGYIPFMEDLKLPLKDIAQCAAEKWKAVACALQLRPCHPRNHASMICRSDCNSLLHECVDLEEASSSGVLPGEFDFKMICEVLSPPPGQPCISLSNYVQHPSAKLPGRKPVVQRIEPEPVITRPCKNHPCNSSQSCQVNRRCMGGNCESYTCSQGCVLGEVSRMIVSADSWVRVPVERAGCQRLCRCGGDGRMESCLPTHSCESTAKCWLGRQHFDHGAEFWLDCNLCSCRSGELICSKRHCARAEEESKGFLFRGSRTGLELALPCNCPPSRSPVCGSNGKTYASACLAKCSGLRGIDISSGECTSRDPCEGVSCGNGRRCIRSKRICLLPLAKQCRQFQCVPLKCEESWHKGSQPVCDTHGRQHRNLCSLTTSGSMLAYPSPCIRLGCSHEGPVCGIDGETYPSDCAAAAQGIPKDYSGPCRFVGVGEGNSLEPACEGAVNCPELPFPCVGVTPPGACCPICGGLLRILYSPHQVLRLAEVTEDQLLSVDDISKRLNGLIQTAQCGAGAYLGIGTELIVVVRPLLKTWTRAQLQACISESERLAAFITQRNPVVQVDAALSVLTAATTSHVSSAASYPLRLLNPSSVVILLLFPIMARLC